AIHCGAIAPGERILTGKADIPQIIGSRDIERRVQRPDIDLAVGPEFLSFTLCGDARPVALLHPSGLFFREAGIRRSIRLCPREEFDVALAWCNRHDSSLLFIRWSGRAASCPTSLVAG